MPLSKEKIQAVINSKDRLNPLTETSGNFTWSFNEKVTRIAEILINAVEIPFTFYTLNSTNNYIRINGLTVTIPVGNYTATTLIPVLQTQMNAVLGGTAVVTFSGITDKMTIGSSINILITANTSGTSPLATLLGYRVTTASAASHVSDSAVNISGPNYLRITSSYLTAQTQHKVLYANDTYQPTLLVVPIHASFGDIITIDPILPIRLSSKITIEKTDIIDFTLYDEFNNIISLNSLDWAMHLTFITE